MEDEIVLAVLKRLAGVGDAARQLVRAAVRSQRRGQAILVGGFPGTGKSALVDACAAELVAAGVIDRAIRRVSLAESFRRDEGAAEEAIGKALGMGAAHPSMAAQLIVLDDIDSIASIAAFETCTPVELRVYQALLVSIDQALAGTSPVLIVGVTSRIEALAPELVRVGRLSERIVLRPPSFRERQDVLQLLCDRASRVSVAPDTIQHAARQSHGYVAADLVRLYRTTALQAAAGARQDGNNSITLDLRHFNMALAGMRPSLLLTTDTTTTTTTTTTSQGFDTVAGLSSTITHLREAICAPMLRTALTPNAPFTRLLTPRGVVFSGPTGCGKTHLARALAHECHLTLISVTGTQFRSKQVGSGAQSLERVFQRARSVAPSLLLIDQCDSLALARSSSTRGASDRLLTLLLTQLDGLASSDRPVLVIATLTDISTVDSALLRPGRLEHHIALSLPSLTDRHALLQMRLTANYSSAYTPLCVASDVTDLFITQLAENTDKFTFADLHGLIVEAGMLSLRCAAQSTHSDSSLGERLNCAQVTSTHLNTALEHVGMSRRKVPLFQS